MENLGVFSGISRGNKEILCYLWASKILLILFRHEIYYRNYQYIGYYRVDETVAGVEQRHDGGVRDAGGFAVGGHP